LSQTTGLTEGTAHAGRAAGRRPRSGQLSAPRPESRQPVALWPGLALATALATVAYILGRAVPFVGGPVFGIVLGMIVAAAARPGPVWRPGIAFASKQVLQAAIVALGTGLSLVQVVRTGVDSLPVMLGTLAVCLGAAWGLGHLLGVRRDLRTLIGVGTGICGASAIAAVSAVVGAAETDIAYAISTIFLFNATAVLLYPPIGHLLHLNAHAFGLWAGTAINDTSSVVAAGDVYGPDARAYAVVVKLTRTTLILPLTLALAAHRTSRLRRGEAPAGDGAARPVGPVAWGKLVPGFLLWFLVASLANTLGLIPAELQQVLARVASVLIVVALSGVGLQARFGEMRRAGLRPLLLGGLLWVAVGLSSLSLQALTHQL
jgi:uncharacterized integral membrane protein (TIGR00698 family)